MNKKYFLALASVAVSVAIYSCGSGDVVDFYNDEIDGVPGQAMLDEMNFTNTLQDESVVNNYKDKYGNGSVPPPESSSSVDPIPTDSTPTGGEIPLSSSAVVIPLSSSSPGPILPPVSSGEDGSSSSSPEEVPLSSSSAPTPELSSSSSDQTPVSSSSANSGESLEPVTCPECPELPLKYADPNQTFEDSGVYKQTFEAPGVYILKLEDAGREGGGQLVCGFGPGSKKSEPQTIMKITNAEKTQKLVIPSNNSESSLGSVTDRDSLVYVQVYDGFSGSFCEHKW